MLHAEKTSARPPSPRTPPRTLGFGEPGRRCTRLTHVLVLTPPALSSRVPPCSDSSCARPNNDVANPLRPQRPIRPGSGAFCPAHLQYQLPADSPALRRRQWRSDSALWRQLKMGWRTRQPNGATVRHKNIDGTLARPVLSSDLRTAARSAEAEAVVMLCECLLKQYRPARASHSHCVTMNCRVRPYRVLKIAEVVFWSLKHCSTSLRQGVAAQTTARISYF